MPQIKLPFPIRSVDVQGVRAEAFGFLIRHPVPRPDEKMSVKEAVDVDKALADPMNSHFCPLCNEFFSSHALRAHAQQCIDARAPREHIWTPPGFSKNATQRYYPQVVDTDLTQGGN